MNPASDAINIVNLVKEYPEGGGVHGLNLRIEKGTSFGLLGPNGAGKSTTLKMIMGLLRPSSGTISVLGLDALVQPEHMRRLVGYVPEHQHMYPWMTVAALVRFVSAFYPTWDHALCRDLLGDYGLSGTKRVRELSNGMQTKLALVLALSHHPELLVLDEPTSGLDPLVREEFLEKVRALVKSRRCTILFSSHIMSDIELVADTVGIMNAGRLLVAAPREDLLRNTRRIIVTLNESHTSKAPPPGTIFEEVLDGRWILTVYGFSDSTLQELRARNPVLDASVSTPDLEMVMKAFVKRGPGRMSKALLWKDLALLRDTISAAIALLVLSYVFAAMIVFTGSAGEFDWSKVLAGGASLARFTSILICALIGGQIYGREHEERSIDFLAQLPIHARTLLFSKLAISAGVMALVWIVSMTMLLVGLGGMGHGVQTSLAVLQAMAAFWAAGVLAFGAAWLASFFIPSAVGASFAGLMSLAVVLLLQFMMKVVLRLGDSAAYQWSTALVTTVLGIGCIALSFRQDLLPNFSFLNGRSIARQSAETSRVRPISALAAVLWKDFQWMKVPLFLGVTVLLLPYIVGCVGWTFLENAAEYFRAASLVCMAMSAFVFTFWAAQITTAEHTGKTIEFSSYLPIPRRDAVVSKLCVAICPAAAVAALNLTTMLVANNSIPGSVQFDRDLSWDEWNQNGFIVMGFALANGTLAALAVSWMLGAHWQRPALAIVAGLIVIPFLILVWASVSSTLAINEGSLSPISFVLVFSSGTAFLGMGTVVKGIAILNKTT